MPIQDRREGITYQKVISILFAGLLATSGIIWNNSQNQIEKSLGQIEKLMETVNNMQKEMSNLNYQIGMLQFRVNSIDSKIDNFPTEKANEFPSRPRFGK